MQPPSTSLGLLAVTRCRGDGGLKSEFATRLAGSADLYNTNKRKPYHSINFVIAHDGFTLADLVAYNEKHNDVNGEGNRERGVLDFFLKQMSQQNI